MQLCPAWVFVFFPLSNDGYVAFKKRVFNEHQGKGTDTEASVLAAKNLLTFAKRSFKHEAGRHSENTLKLKKKIMSLNLQLLLVYRQAIYICFFSCEDFYGLLTPLDFIV